MTTTKLPNPKRGFPRDNKFKIGLFGANCSSGRSYTTVPERWSGSWQDCARLAAMGEEAGIDFMLPIGRWRGYGGDTDYQGSTLESVSWASGLLALTKRLVVFATIHAPLTHPVIAAKQFVTADHIGEGRFALNVVCGWNEDEFNMFGVAQRPHDLRYDYAQEWIDAIFRMWGDEEDFDVEGQFINLKKVRAKPKPFGGTKPIIMNAGSSGRGRDFAVRNCDAFFTTLDPNDPVRNAAAIAEVKEAAAKHDRDIDVYGVSAICCRPTRREAEEYHRYCTVENADWAAIDHTLHMAGILPENTPAEKFEEHRDAFANGRAGQANLVGTPDDIAAWFADYSAAGLSGIATSFVNYTAEFPYFAAEVLPRLKRLGLRVE